MKYLVTQSDSDETVISSTEFDHIPTLSEFSDIAYGVDRGDLRKVYKDLISNINSDISVGIVGDDGYEDVTYFTLEEDD